ncbi:TRAF2 factor, partial [Polypterus senegalus]
MAAQDPSPPTSLESVQPGFPRQVLANKLEVKHLCNACLLLLRRPCQAQCGHRYCSFCFKRLVSCGPQKCNACIKEDMFEEPTSILTEGCAFPDNAARREVEGLAAVCPNEGCSWRGTIKEYEAQHEGKCEFALTQCPACGQTIRMNDAERHNERECPERTLNCKYCKEVFHFKSIKAHDEICPKFPMVCEGCAKKKIPREKVENEKIPEHEQACAYEHLNMLLHYIMGIKVNLEGLQPQSLENASLKIHKLNESMRELEQKLGQLALSPVQGAAQLVPLMPAAGVELQLLSEKSRVGELSRKVQELELKISTFENIVCVLNREVERSCSTLDAYGRQHRLDQEKIEVLSTKVRQLERSVSLKDLAVAESEGRLRELASATYDGVFIWKISDFSKKRQDAVAGRAPAMFSPAFYTSKYGYKMCLRIYLNGDGTGRGTHLSLFFVVMRGPCDALLKWPFNQKVTLMLLDQNNREHIIDAFRPDVTSSSFQRPSSEMNIASGCPLFCPLSKLDSKNSYIRDDTIFIKAIVDLTGL